MLALLQPAKVAMRSINNGGQAIFEKPTTFAQSWHVHKQKTYFKQSPALGNPSNMLQLWVFRVGFTPFFFFFFWLSSLRKNWTIKITLINAHKHHEKCRKGFKREGGIYRIANALTEWSKGTLPNKQSNIHFLGFLYHIFGGGGISIGMPNQIILFITWYI